MDNKHLQKIISSLIMISIVFAMPSLVLVKKAGAQGWNSNGSGWAESGVGFSGSVGVGASLGGIAANLPLCRDSVISGISNIFSGNPVKSTTKVTTVWGGNLEDITEENLESFDSVPVNSDVLNKKVDKIEKLAKSTDKNVSSIEENDTCLKSIARFLAKKLLQELTLSTVEWINGGFDGEPTWISGEDNFWGELAKNEILQFGLEIDNPELFPFGKAFMQNQARAFQARFADNAQYSLDKFIRQTNPEYSSEDFYKDFSKGGWAGWEALTQIPANNPLGFQLMASNELQKRLEGTDQSKAENLRESIQANMGFMGKEQCIEPRGVTKEMHNAYLRNEENGVECTGGFEYVTPGSMIAAAATETLKYPQNNYLKIEDLNGALAVLGDALLNQFSAKLFGDGYLSLNTMDNWSSGLDGEYIKMEGSDFANRQAQGDFSTSTVEASSFLSQNPDFNIRTDLNQAVVDEQRIFMEKLVKQNYELSELIKVIHQLDYCIPGPNPNWEYESYSNLQKTLANTPTFEEQQEDPDEFIEALWGTISGTLGNLYRSSIFSLLGNGTNPQAKYYRGIIKMLTGMEPESDAKIQTKQQVNNVMNTIFSRYSNIIKQVYDDNPKMPKVTKEANNEYQKIAGYEILIEKNKERIESLKNVIVRLTNIKKSVDDYRLQMETGGEDGISDSADEYVFEERILEYIDSFARLSTEMVSGDDIAEVDQINKEVVDKKGYIYKILLKGPEGCEADLSTGQAVGMPWQVFAMKRREYPTEKKLLYDYNNYQAGEELPDPLGLMNANEPKTKMRGPETEVNGSNYGFVSALIDTRVGYCSTEGHFQEDQFVHETNHPGFLTLWVNEEDKFSGNLLTMGSSICPNTLQFESTIGIY